MNFTTVLSAFQGAILSADNVHQFTRLSAKGGNEDEIDYIVTSMSRFLEQSQYISDGKIQNTIEVRKFALYIVLNADLPVLQQLIEVEAVSTVIWTTPTITKCLMCEMMWNLHMKQFISEIISYAHPQLALEVVSAFLDNFKYFNPLDCLEQLKLLSASCYLLICRLHLFNYEAPVLTQKTTAAFNSFQQCLKYYSTPPNNHKLNTLNKTDLYKYQGKSLYSLLQLIEECLNHFTKKLDLNIPDGLYKLTYTEGSLKEEAPSFNVCDSSNNIVLECLNNANVAMLDTCKVLVMDVSVDVFCCWSEIEEHGKSMQQSVGELCYRVHNKLLSCPSVADHPVVSMFEQIARKPLEMKDKINAASVENIEINVSKNNHESKEWIKALIYREKLCQNLQLLNIVASNVDIYDSEESNILFSTIKTSVSSDTENRDFIDALSVKVFQNCDTSTKYSILEEHFINKTLTDMTETPEFQTEMTTIFNRLIASKDGDCTDVLKLFLQSPQKVYAKIFVLACENTQQTEIMLKVMSLLMKFSDHYYNTDTDPCIMRMIQNRLESRFDRVVKESHFVKFISGLKKTNIISGTKLFLLIIMTNMHKLLLNKDILGLRVLMELLKGAYELEELIVFRAPLLAMLAQVVNVVRWNLNTYSNTSAAVLDTSLELVHSLMYTYNGVVRENESKWLKRKLVSLKPLNMYYYRILWNPPGVNYMEVVSGMKIDKDMNLDEIVAWMEQVLCECTRQEWCALYHSLAVFGSNKVLKIFHDVIVNLTLKEKLNHSESSGACMSYVYKLFILVLRFKYFKEPLTDEQITTAVYTVASLTKHVTEENLQQFVASLVPFFSFLIEKEKSYNINLSDCLKQHFGPTMIWSNIKNLCKD